MKFTVKFGSGYNNTRRADPRIAEGLFKLLDLDTGSLVADIGAGTGNYAVALANRGHYVKAIEPSRVLLQQSAPHEQVEYINGTAEEIPLPDYSVNGVISVLSLHHFSHRERALQEMTRIVGDGPIVFFTLHPNLSENVWIFDYFPAVWEDMKGFFPCLDESLDVIKHVTKKRVDVETFKLPYDLRDLFIGAGWKTPQLYTDPDFLSNTSPFLRANTAELQEAVAKLEKDLSSGKWADKYGSLLARMEMDLGFRFLKAWG